MNNRINYTSCPVCNSPSVSKQFSVKDHTVSNELFDIYHCINCQLRFTQDVPDKFSIGDYYKSEDYISHTDTSKGFVNRLYRFVRNWSNSLKRKLIENESGKKNGNLLDVGSGTGYFVQTMKQSGWEVTGLEPDEGARLVALKQNKAVLLPLNELNNLPGDHFDVITLWHVLEHVHDLRSDLIKFKKLLTADGKLLVAVPNYTSYDAEVYKSHWAAYDVPRHLYHFTPHTMQVLAREMGLKISAIKPMWFDSFYVSLLSSKYKNGKINWPGAIWTGLVSNLKAMGDVKKCSSLIYVISK